MAFLHPALAHERDRQTDRQTDRQIQSQIQIDRDGEVFE